MLCEWHLRSSTYWEVRWKEKERIDCELEKRDMEDYWEVESSSDEITNIRFYCSLFDGNRVYYEDTGE